MRILLVDDDAFLRDMYVTKFTQLGDEVAIAQDGRSALSVIAEDSFDVILLDMIMPGMTGLDLLKEIKVKNLAPKSKCIVLSNQGETSDIAAAKEFGADGYIIKAESIPSEVVEKVHAIVK